MVGHQQPREVLQVLHSRKGVLGSMIQVIQGASRGRPIHRNSEKRLEKGRPTKCLCRGAMLAEASQKWMDTWHILASQKASQKAAVLWSLNLPSGKLT